MWFGIQLVNTSGHMYTFNAVQFLACQQRLTSFWLLYLYYTIVMIKRRERERGEKGGSNYSLPFVVYVYTSTKSECASIATNSTVRILISSGSGFVKLKTNSRFTFYLPAIETVNPPLSIYPSFSLSVQQSVS